MEGRRIYLQPKDMVFGAMLDLMELQKGEEMQNDPISGKLHFRITMYGETWVLRFYVMMIDMTRCVVTLEIEDEGEDTDAFGETHIGDMIRREYAILDSMLLIG